MTACPAIALALVLLAPTAGWADPTDPEEADPSTGTYAPADTAPPSRTDAEAFVATLRRRVQDATASGAWLREHARPAALPHAPEGWYTSLERALAPDTLTSRTLVHAPITHIGQGPATTRVVFGDAPALSLVLRAGPDGPLLDTLEVTPCVACAEPERWIRGRLAAVSSDAPGHRAVQPGIDVVVPHASEDPEGDAWIGVLGLREQVDGTVRRALHGARLGEREGDTWTVHLATGRTDTWRVVWAEGRWALDGAALAPDSPLRMPESELRRWRWQGPRSRAAVTTWTPSWRRHPAGVGLALADRAVGLHVDPHDGQVLVAAMDLDRVLCGLFRVDPATRTVTRRYRVPPPSPRTNLAPEDWFDQWAFGVSPDGEQAVWSTPSRTWRIDLATGRVRYLTHHDDARSIAWDGSTPILVRPRGQLVALPPEGGQRALRLPDDVAHLAVSEAGPTAVLRDGRVVRVRSADGDPLAEPEVVLATCCEGVGDVAESPDGAELLITCTPRCSSVAERVAPARRSGTALSGRGVAGPGASWSPTGRHFTTPAAGDTGLLVWDAARDVPVARVPVERLSEVTWSSDGHALITRTGDGTVWWWPLDEVEAAFGL